MRDAIDRLLPVASVGGSVAGVRLVRWRGLAAIPVSASIIVEILLTLIVSYLFAALAWCCCSTCMPVVRNIVGCCSRSCAVCWYSTVTALLLRYGSVFKRLHGLLRPFVGEGAIAEGAASLDQELAPRFVAAGDCGCRRPQQLAALVSGSFEIWFALCAC